MRVMGVKGLTLYHLKSHLQKFRLGKQPHKEFNDHSAVKDASDMELHGNTASSSGLMGRSMNDSNVHITDSIRMQMEVQRRLQEQLEVQRHLQLRIEAQGKYMQNILEKACQTLAGETNMGGSGSYKGHDIVGNSCAMVDHLGGSLKEYGPHPPMNFPSFQDLNIYGGDHHNMDRPASLDNFMQPSSLGMGKKRGNPYNGNNGKSPLLWSDDQDPFKTDIQIAPPGSDHQVDSVSETYESKSMLSSLGLGDSSPKFDRHTPVGVVSGRSSPYA